MSDLEKTLRPVDNEAEKTVHPGIRAEKTTRGNPENVEKTIRGGDNEAEKTMRPVDKTTRGEAIAEKTTRGVVMTEKTMRGDTGKTTHPNRQEEIDKVVRQIEQQAGQTEYLLNNITYKVVKPLSESTGEADVYLVENANIQYALKLYKPGIEPDKDIIEIVRKNSGNPAINFLVDTLHHGLWTNPKTGQLQYYELMVYCQGGSLDQITIPHNAEGEQLLGEIAIKCAVCLDFLHSKQVIHRDVKPANFFFREKGNKVEELSLADFGIAIRCDENGEAKVKIQMRTKIYAAPEYYVTIDGIAITKSMDFYSLGMMLLVLWEGGEDRYRAPGERVLWTLKQDNKLPYPQDMPPRLLQLARALTIADPEKRAGFKEVIKWAKGEDIYNEENIQFNIVYNATKKQIAKSREELVKFMMEDQKLATTYLYRGQISAWLKEINFTELSTPLDEITETQFPKNKEAGFWAACYFLHPNLKYLDINNRAIEENEEIAASLKENFDYYSEALADKNDKLFIYLNATGRGEVNKLVPLFKKGKDNRDAMLQLIYALDPSLPWTMTDDNGKTVDCQTTDEVLLKSVNPDFPISEESENDLLTEAFLTWIGTRDKALEGKLRTIKGHDKDIWILLYNLNPKISYNFVLDENADNYFFTASEIGNYINNQMDIYMLSDNDYASEQLDMMCDIDDTRLYHYFKSKGGVYDDKIDWIKYCADVKSKDNANKAGPYNWKIGVYKAIKGLGFDPYYYFPKSDKYVYTLDELKEIPRKEIKAEMAKGYLDAWLTTFFQEDPDLDLSPQFAYEEATDEYMQKLEELDENHEDVVNYRLATDQLVASVSGLKRKYRFNLFSKAIIIPLTLIAVAAVIYGLLSLDIPKERDFHSIWIYVVSFIVGIAAMIYNIYDIGSDTGCVGILFIGGLAAVIVYFGLLFIAPYLVYIAAAFLAFLVVMMIVQAVKTAITKRGNADLFAPSTEELILEPLHFAFRAPAGENFNSSIGDRIWDLTWDIGQNTKAFYKKLIVPWVLIIAFGTISFVVLGNFDASRITGIFSGKGAIIQQQYTLFQGEWKGTFDGRDAVMQISKAGKDVVEATISVQYQNLITENLTGSINVDEKSFHFDDVHANGNLDGEYNGKFNDDFTEFSGTYQNYTTKKQVDFIFVK
ncbi:protein kinase domain-containing protein [Proteiniphilum sp.]|uniref:protein kinase domain-containing protein n=1 Tax=Proteiniphilum sp. TaxID=1926877 RepID=UPI002B2170E3|nr:protein kinase [Proteiniphilum sp.]MEA4919166.1 protein kinase [Proteiniphilum sp.]